MGGYHVPYYERDGIRKVAVEGEPTAIFDLSDPGEFIVANLFRAILSDKEFVELVHIGDDPDIIGYRRVPPEERKPRHSPKSPARRVEVDE